MYMYYANRNYHFAIIISDSAATDKSNFNFVNDAVELFANISTVHAKLKF